MAPSDTDQLSVTLLRPAVQETLEASGDDRPGIAENLTLTEATELLDWLEGHGIQAREVQLQADGRMTVRWG